jgi:hypothetical protein
MRWSGHVPRWVGIFCGLFGVVCIAGGVSSAFWLGSFDDVLPGLVVGGAWAVFGFKGGFPIVPAGDGSIPSGLRALRRRLVLMYAFPFAWAPVFILVMTSVPDRMSSSVFTLLALPMFVVVGFALLGECPRCGKHFFVAARFRLFPKRWITRCQNCGGGLREASSSPAV